MTAVHRGRPDRREPHPSNGKAEVAWCAVCHVAMVKLGVWWHIDTRLPP